MIKMIVVFLLTALAVYGLGAKIASSGWSFRKKLLKHSGIVASVTAVATAVLGFIVLVF